MDDSHKIDFLSPLSIALFFWAVLIDIAIIFGALSMLIPIVGLVITLLMVFVHYLGGLVIIIYFWNKTSGLLPKAILLLSWVLPLPLITIGLGLAIVASNKIVAIIIEQVVIQAVAVATAGTGEALEVGAVAAEGVEVAATAAEGVEATEAVAEGAEVAGEAGEAASGAVETGAEAAQGSAEAGTEAAEGGEASETGKDMDLTREEKNPLENLQEDLTQPQEDEFSQNPEPKEEVEGEEEEEPKEKEDNEAVKRTKKVFDILNRGGQPQQQEESDEDEDQELDQAA